MNNSGSNRRGESSRQAGRRNKRLKRMEAVAVEEWSSSSDESTDDSTSDNSDENGRPVEIIDVSSDTSSQSTEPDIIPYLGLNNDVHQDNSLACTISIPKDFQKKMNIPRGFAVDTGLYKCKGVSVSYEHQRPMYVEIGGRKNHASIRYEFKGRQWANFVGANKIAEGKKYVFQYCADTKVVLVKKA